MPVSRGIRSPLKVVRGINRSPGPQYAIRNDPPYTKSRYKTQAVNAKYMQC